MFYCMFYAQEQEAQEIFCWTPNHAPWPISLFMFFKFTLENEERP